MTSPISSFLSAPFSNISKGDLVVGYVVVVIINKIAILFLKQNTFTQISNLKLEDFTILDTYKQIQKILNNNNNKNKKIIDLLTKHNKHKIYSLITYCALFVFSVSRDLFPCQYIAIILACIDWTHIAANTALINDLSDTCVIKTDTLTKKVLESMYSCKVLITEAQKSTLSIWKYELIEETPNRLDINTTCTDLRFTKTYKLNKTKEHSKYFN